VAGSSSSIPRIGKACSAYLVEDNGFRFSLDFGTGALANMRRYADYDELDAVVISHMHADHFLDLIPLRYAIRYGPRRRLRPLPLWVPPGGEATLRKLASAFASEGDDDFLDPAFVVREFDPVRGLALGDGVVRFALTTHYIDAYAIRYDRGDASITYSADTAPDARVVALARDTSVFLCEATLLAGAAEGKLRGHSSAAEAAQMATDAGAHKLVLTHYGENATVRDLDESARAMFSGEIVVADDHAVISA
jgi:ribonuclease BN (tRNA processing enzyme)